MTDYQMRVILNLEQQRDRYVTLLRYTRKSVKRRDHEWRIRFYDDVIKDAIEEYEEINRRLAQDEKREHLG